MPILTGIIGGSVGIVLNLLILIITGCNMTTWMFLFVFPIGGMLLGSTGGYGYKVGYRLMGVEREVGCGNAIVALLLGIAIFYGSQYAVYSSTYVTPDMKINHVFRGDHISNYCQNSTGQPITFTEFLHLTMQDGLVNIYFSIARGRVRGEVPDVTMPSGYGRFSFYASLIGCTLGCVGAYGKEEKKSEKLGKSPNR